MTNTIAIIPARGGSKRLSQKNILMLGGLPLVAHPVVYAKSFPQIINEVYVSTDDNDIKEISLKFGAKVIDRPAHLATDTTPTIEVLQHAVEHLNVTDGWVVLLQPTNPLRPKGLLEEAFAKLELTGADSLFTITPHHQKLGTLQNEQFKPYNYTFGQRSQDMEALYFENGLLYITKPQLIKQGLIMGPKHTTLIVDHPYARVDIDTQADLDYARYVAQNFNNF